MAIGARMLRVEDRPLLTGRAQFVDDIHVDGMLEAAFVRSRVAHGRLLDPGIRRSGEAAGIEAAFAADDLELPPLRPPNTNPGVAPPPEPVLATGKVRFAGEPIAVVVGRDRYAAEDGCDAAEPQIAELEPLVDPWRAIADGAPEIHPGSSNLVVDISREEGDLEAAFGEAEIVVERTFRSPRRSAMPIEGRAVLAVPDGDRLHLWSSSQAPHKVREAIADSLGVDPASVRVTTPDVGGGFGVKAHVYPEEIVLAAVALRLGRPVKWVEDRAENLAAATQARQQELRVRAAMSAAGELLGLDVDMLCNQGAYGAYPHGVSLEALTTSGMIPGPYRLSNYRYRVRTALTNTAPVGAYRGVGFVLATFVHERMIEILAREAGLDPAEVRRRNMIAADQLPSVSITGQPYDGGDYRRALDTALDLVGYRELAGRRRDPGSGRRLGVGISSYVEPTGMNSKVFELRGMVGVAGTDSAYVALDGNGEARVWTTTPAIGQGGVTTTVQLAAESLGIPPDRIRVEHSDTAAAELRGTGTFASRSAVSTGGAVVRACSTLRERLLDDAAERLEAAPGDLRIVDRRIEVAGTPSAAVEIAELVAADPERFRVGTEFDPPQTVYPYATHACVVSIDEDTGEARIERYVVVEDCGRIINPMIVEGQVHGAVAQGIGGGLLEAHEYDEQGQLRTASLADYVIPTAAELPPFELVHLELPTPASHSGVKGVGEGGTIGAAPAVVNAIANALDTELNAFPVSPERIVAELQARARA